jgi:hypothetical protein
MQLDVAILDFPFGLLYFFGCKFGYISKTWVNIHPKSIPFYDEFLRILSFLHYLDCHWQNNTGALMSE